MSRALIGHTGFVGSFLRAGGAFSDLFNSSNIQSIRDRHFDEIVCAGVPAVKWLANREPENDLIAIDRLLSPLFSCTARSFILISTIDVYPDPTVGADETAAIDGSSNHPYGRHRLMVEESIQAHFENTLIVRLPALFGRGLKKNIIFDLLNGNQTDKINPATAFQWYDLERLNSDIAKARSQGLRLINLFPEPVATAAIIHEVFPGAKVGLPVSPAAHYRTKTAHSALYGGPEGFICSAAEAMSDLKAFVENQRTQAGAQL